MNTNIIKSSLYKIGLYKYAKKYLKKPYKFIRRFIFKLSSNEAIKKFVNVMNKYNKPYWLEFGTLLGAIRDDGIIPHDYDIDIAMHIDDRTDLTDELRKEGFTLVKRALLLTGEIIEETYKYKTSFIDIFYAYNENNKTIIYDYETFNNTSPKECIKKYGGLRVHKNKLTQFELKNHNVFNSTVLIPKNISEHLTELYTEDYLIPDKNWSKKKRKIRVKTDKLCEVIYFN